MILDLLLILCIAVFVIVGTLRGGIKTLLSLISTALAFVLSLFCSAWLANWIYNSFISERLTEALAAQIAENSTQALQSVTDVFPEFINSLLEFNGIDIDAVAGGAAADAAAQAVELAVAPVIISVMSAALVIIVFLLIKIIFSCIIRSVNRIFSLPVLKQFNRILGFICGLVQGIIVVLLITAAFRSLTVSDGGSVLAREYIESSLLFKYFYRGDVLNAVLNLIG